jgi:hypothetical protein
MYEKIDVLQSYHGITGTTELPFSTLRYTALEILRKYTFFDSVRAKDTNF